MFQQGLNNQVTVKYTVEYHRDSFSNTLLLNCSGPTVEPCGIPHFHELKFAKEKLKSQH